MQRPVHPSLGRVKTVVDIYGWTGKKEGKKVFPNHRYCQLCLKSESKWCRMGLWSVSGRQTHFKLVKLAYLTDFKSCMYMCKSACSGCVWPMLLDGLSYSKKICIENSK